MKVSVVIPALNEEETVGNVVTQCLKSCADEVIVLDSDSADATAARAADIGERDRINALAFAGDDAQVGHYETLAAGFDEGQDKAPDGKQGPYSYQAIAKR